MEIREEDIDQLLQARTEIDDELRRHQTEQTVLFTDIVGSTSYFDRFGDTEGLLLLYRHDTLVKNAVEEFKGIVVKTIGDSVMAQFADPLPAVHAAIAIQQRLHQHNQSLARHERLQIRIGIHSGFGFRRANDLFGDTVNIAARITKQSGPAQILVSQSVSEMMPATELLLKSLGIVNLKGKADSEEVYEVVWMEAGAYDALRCSLSGISGGAQQDDFVQKPHPFKGAGLLRARIMTLGRLPGMGFVRSALAFAAYLTIAAGMFSSRTDTRQPTVPENAAVQKPVETIQLETAPTGIAPEMNTPSSNQAATSVPEVAAVMKPATADLPSSWMSLIETVPIPGGTFEMGNDNGKADERPQHQVKLDGFNMSRTEITNRQYLAFLADTGYPRPRDPSFAKRYLMDYPDLPVVNVSYEDAIAFCAWASAKFDAVVRLPTEAEWEYAAIAVRAGVPVPLGPQDPRPAARFKGNTPRGVATVAKGVFPPNRFGLYNMSGNVWEWVQDYYSKNYYATSPIRNPAGPTTGTKRLMRGGSWADDSALWATRRANGSPGERSDQIGFRIVASH